MRAAKSEVALFEGMGKVLVLDMRLDRKPVQGFAEMHHIQLVAEG